MVKKSHKRGENLGGGGKKDSPMKYFVRKFLTECREGIKIRKREEKLGDLRSYFQRCGKLGGSSESKVKLNIFWR